MRPRWLSLWCFCSAVGLPWWLPRSLLWALTWRLARLGGTCSPSGRAAVGVVVAAVGVMVGRGAVDTAVAVIRGACFRAVGLT